MYPAQSSISTRCPAPNGYDLNLDVPGASVGLASSLALPTLQHRGWQRRFHNRRYELRRVAFGTRQWLARLPPPCEDLLRRKTVAASYRRNHGVRNKRLFNNPRLELRSKLTPSPSPANYFQSLNRRHLRLNHMVKFRHKPISDSEINTVVHHTRP
jgi:hypothetical protein